MQSSAMAQPIFEQEGHRGVYKREPGQTSESEAAPEPEQDDLAGALWVVLVEARD